MGQILLRNFSVSISSNFIYMQARACSGVMILRRGRGRGVNIGHGRAARHHHSRFSPISPCMAK